MGIIQISLLALLLIVIYGIVKGWGDNRSIIIFKNYDDLGLTFLVPASFILLVYISSAIGLHTIIGIFVASVVSLWIFSMLIKNTFEDNSRELSKTVLALITKMSLSVVWVLSLVQVLNPSGEGGRRTRNRGKALVILTLLTPIIGMVVVEKSGSHFNPRNWIRGRRVGSIVRGSL